MSRSGVGKFFLVGGLVLAAIGAAIFLGAGGGVPGSLPGSGSELGPDVGSITRMGGSIVGTVLFSIGAIWALVGFGVSGWYRSLAAKDAADEQLFATGDPAIAVVERVEGTATSINDMPLVRLYLRIEPRSSPAFHSELKVVVPHQEVPMPGMRIQAAVDPMNPSRFALRQRPGFSAPPAKLFALAGPADGSWAHDGGASGGTSSDVAEQLERLAELHRAGDIDADEYERAKDRLLGG